MLAQLKIRTFCYGVLNLKNTKLKKKTCFIWRSFQLTVLKFERKGQKLQTNLSYLFWYVKLYENLQVLFYDPAV